MVTFLRICGVVLTVGVVVFVAAGLDCGAIILAAGAANIAVAPGVIVK